MKARIIFLICMLLNIGLFSQTGEVIQAKLNGIKSNGNGQIIFLLFNKSDGFPAEVSKAQSVGIVKKFSESASFQFKDVPPGQYAISVFYDKNSSGDIDRNFFGFPKEPVGASNMKKLGRPNFSNSQFEYSGMLKEVPLKLLNQ